MPMKEIPDELIKQIQQKSLEMLLYFQKICDENNLLFYFCGGCCIGTVRHKGFIPWDDDVDVFMPRDDYERLIEIWDSVADTSRYSLQVTTAEVLTKNMFATVCDNNTTFIKSFQADLDINHGLVIDILPLDGCPTGRFKRLCQKIWALTYSLYIIGEAPTNHGAAVKLFGKVMLALVPFKSWRYRLWKTAQKHMTKYPISECSLITELCSGPVHIKDEFPADAFRSAVKMEFEGHMMPIPVGYDSYLKIAFGDYMTLPPEDQRKAHHDFDFIDMNRSYKEYKGIYYCKKGE